MHREKQEQEQEENEEKGGNEQKEKKEKWKKKEKKQEQKDEEEKEENEQNQEKEKWEKWEKWEHCTHRRAGLDDLALDVVHALVVRAFPPGLRDVGFERLDEVGEERVLLRDRGALHMVATGSTLRPLVDTAAHV